MEAITFFFFLFFHVGGKTVSRGVPISLVAKSHLLIDQIMRYILQTFNITPLAKVQTLPTVHTFTTPAVRRLHNCLSWLPQPTISTHQTTPSQSADPESEQRSFHAQKTWAIEQPNPGILLDFCSRLFDTIDIFSAEILTVNSVSLLLIFIFPYENATEPHRPLPLFPYVPPPSSLPSSFPSFPPSPSLPPRSLPSSPPSSLHSSHPPHRLHPIPPSQPQSYPVSSAGYPCSTHRRVGAIWGFPASSVGAERDGWVWGRGEFLEWGVWLQEVRGLGAGRDVSGWVWWK